MNITMAEQFPSFTPKENGAHTAQRLDTGMASRPENVTFYNFNPDEHRRDALKRIGEVTMSMAVRDEWFKDAPREFIADYGEILSSEPMFMEEDVENGIVEVTFLQYWRGCRGDSMGTPHTGYKRPDDGGKSLETVRILAMKYDPIPAETDQFVTGSYLPPRIHKHKLLDYWSRLRSERGRNEIAAIRNGLWGDGR